jgi:hypothetical protein
MPEFNIAQLNVARMKFALDDPAMADFVAQLENINALADASPGFVWRLQSEDGDATSIDCFGADTLVNMSVWIDLESLHRYVYRSAHNRIMARRKQWFAHMLDAYSVLWWVPDGHLPTPHEARLRLEALRRHGPTPQAFTFKRPFSAPSPDGDDADA